MTNAEVAQQRLQNQQLLGATCKRPEEVVRSLGAAQAQDYTGAKWALGLRLPDVTEADVEAVFTAGALLRTHVLRPTWHFVTPADIRWLLALTGTRVHAANAPYYRKSELDAVTLKRSRKVLEKALCDGRQLTRDELREVLQGAGIPTEGEFRINYLMMHAELEGVVCSGARRGKQFTYALLEERVPPAKTWEREAALAELVRRYFTTRGPATLHDFAWWSGLTLADARQGVALLASELAREEMDGKTYYFPPSSPPAKASSPTAHLLPNYDEYFIGLKDRSAIMQRLRDRPPGELQGWLGVHIIVVEGQVVGGWKRTLKRSEIVMELGLLTPLTAAERRAVVDAAQRYGRVHGQAVSLTYTGL